MFADAIEQITECIRPVKTISRMYKSEDVIPQTATMFFVNGEGAAITCRHVAEEIMRASKLNARYESFKKERSSVPPECNMRIETNRMERRYGYGKGETKIQLRYHFPGCFEKIARLGMEMHTFYDLALIRISGEGRLLYRGGCVFRNGGQKARVGMSLCRIGYPVTEFDDYTFSRSKDEIQWTAGGTHTVTQYPAEGMFIRPLKTDDRRVLTFELSGEVAEGYAGAPVFDREGFLVGMVTGTVTRIVDGRPVVTSECVSADVIREFLVEKKVRFTER